MATNEKLSQLPTVAQTLASDKVYCVQNGVSVQETVAQIAGYYQSVFLPLAGGTMTGNINLGNNNINTGILDSSVSVGVGSLNSGTNASASTFWRGDGTWVALGTTVIGNVPAASAISLTTNTIANVGSISIPAAGTWLTNANVTFQFSGLSTACLCWISQFSAALPDLSHVNQDTYASTSGLVKGTSTPTGILVVASAPMTIYFSCEATFTTGSATACGTITSVKIA